MTEAKFDVYAIMGISATVVIHVYKFDRWLQVFGPARLLPAGGITGREPNGQFVNGYRISGDKNPVMPETGFASKEELEAWLELLKANGLTVEELAERQ